MQLHWKPLNDWVALYEPVHQDTERKKRVKGAIRSKATSVLLNTMDERIVHRVLRLILDVSSQILTRAELQLASDDTTVSLILNNLNTWNALDVSISTGRTASRM